MEKKKKIFDVVVRVKSVTGKCPKDHVVGQDFKLGNMTPEGICDSAYNSIFTAMRVLQFGGSFYWEDDPDVANIACIDPENQVVFELRRIRGEGTEQ